MKAKRFDARHLCTVVLTKNYKRMVAWYKKALDLKAKTVVAEGFDWTELARPGLRIGFTPAVQMGARLASPRRNAVILHLVSRDVKGLLARVKRAGAKAWGPKRSEDGAYWYGGFVDIEGNPVWVIDLED